MPRKKKSVPQPDEEFSWPALDGPRFEVSVRTGKEPVFLRKFETDKAAEAKTEAEKYHNSTGLPVMVWDRQTQWPVLRLS